MLLIVIQYVRKAMKKVIKFAIIYIIILPMLGNIHTIQTLLLIYIMI